MIDYDRPIDGGGRRRPRARRRHGHLPFSLPQQSHDDRKDLGGGSRLDWMRKLEFERRKDRERSSSRKGSGCVRQRVRLARHEIRRRGGIVPPTPNQPPRGAQGRRLLGPATLRTCPFASLLSQVRARRGPGGYCRRSGNGGPQTCLPAACGVAKGTAQYGLTTSTQAQDPREGPSLTGWTTQGFLRGGLTRQAREEVERSRQGYLAWFL